MASGKDVFSQNGNAVDKSKQALEKKENRILSDENAEKAREENEKPVTGRITKCFTILKLEKKKPPKPKKEASLGNLQDGEANGSERAP